MQTKDTNPKDAVGIRKVALHHVPCQPLMELGLAMGEGAIKYGSHNYRIAGVRASVYYDAALRHLMAWWEGEDNDPDSGLPHLVKAMACLCVIRDAVCNSNWVDDRPPSLKSGWINDLNKKAGDLIDRLPNAKEPYTRTSNLPSSVQSSDCSRDWTRSPWKEYQDWMDRQELASRAETTTDPLPSPSHGSPVQLPLGLQCIDPKQRGWLPHQERQARSDNACKPAAE